MSDEVCVTIAGREVMMTVEEAETLRKAIGEQTRPILSARREAAFEQARAEGRLWTAVVNYWNANGAEREECLSRSEALGALYSMRDADVGCAVSLIEPDGTEIPADALDDELDNLYDEDGNYRVGD